MNPHDVQEVEPAVPEGPQLFRGNCPSCAHPNEWYEEPVPATPPKGIVFGSIGVCGKCGANVRGLPKDAPAPLASTPTSPFASATREQLRRMLDAEPFGLEQLSQIARFCESSVKSFQSLERPTAGSALKTLGDPLPGVNVSSVNLNPYGSYGPGTENYGTKMIRELVEGFKGLQSGKKKATPEQQVRAIAQAREMGLDELAAKLEAQLLGGLALGRLLRGGLALGEDSTDRDDTKPAQPEGTETTT